jgi:hypothetical protein
MAAAMLDGLFSKCLKLTLSRYMLKISANTYVILSVYDNKKLFLSGDDIEMLRIKVFDTLPLINTNHHDMWVDIFLEKSIVKW